MPSRTRYFLAYTLIELLVVISIMNFLTSVIMASAKSARDSAREKKLIADLRSIITQIDSARGTVNKVTGQITGSWWTAGNCNNTSRIKDQPACLTALRQAWQRLGFNSTPMDPWGVPYMLDENEWEGGSGNCNRDTIWSAGPNGIWGGGDDQPSPGWYNIPPYFCKGL